MRNVFRKPLMLGAIVPSSRFLVNDLLAQINWEQARLVVEYGPGVGTITREVLRRMRPDAVLVAIELNDEFASFLEHDIRDPRLRVVHGSAMTVRQVLEDRNLTGVDYVISGIPFSSMPKAMRYELAQQTREVLGSTGRFLVYQYTRTVLPCLKSSFSSVQQNFQLLNIPPSHMFFCMP